MATVAGPQATRYTSQGSTRYFGPLQPNHKAQTRPLHDRWNEGTGEDDHGLQSEYGERSRTARAPMRLGVPQRMPLTQAKLPLPCVCGNYALALDPSGTWLDFAFAGPPSGSGRSGQPMRDTIIELLMEHMRGAHAHAGRGARKEYRAELESLSLQELKVRARRAKLAVAALEQDQAAESPRKTMCMSLAFKSGTYRCTAGHNSGMMVRGFGNKGRQGYQRDRKKGQGWGEQRSASSGFEALARARQGPKVAPGQYRFGENGQWVVALERSGQVVVTYYAEHKLGDGPSEEYYWTDPSQEFSTSNGARRQAGQLVLRPDGGFHEGSAVPAHGSVQKLARGTVAMGGSDLTRWDSAAERKEKFANHQHFGGKAPYYTQETLDRALVDPKAPGLKLLHSTGHGSQLDSRQAKVSSKDCHLHPKSQLAPWALHEEVDRLALA
eukprot:COSAG02_NODE_3800_length_6212_cov_1.933421_1_plen_438_part_10